MLLSVALGVLAVTSKSVWAQTNIAEAFAESEAPIAKAGILANIGPSGSLSQGALSGIVVASPSTENPDYLYNWVRDAGVAIGCILQQYTLGIDTDPTYRDTIDNYVAAQVPIQNIFSFSGGLLTGGLGEPKFNIDETAFLEAWGRPQRDGPALRSTALITWANFLLGENNDTYVTDTLWPIIENDLNYVAQDWNQSTFDLWEEVFSSSFFTTAIQHRALRQGVALADTLGQSSLSSTYETQANYLLCFLQTYWNEAGSHLTANTAQNGRSAIDANSILGSIHTFDASAGCDALTFQPCSDLALLNLYTYVNAFRDIYTINDGFASNEAVLTGRYPEDVYMGGNPWYLTTLAVAEQLYDSLIVWKSQGSLEVTSNSLPFFNLFDSSITAGTYASSTSQFADLTSAVQVFADGFVAGVANHTPSGGGLAEQISRTNGTPVSAVDLTWSFAAALTAFNARNGVVPPSWGAKGLSLECSGQPGPTVDVTFNVDTNTVFGQNVFVTGDVDALQNWSTSTPIALSSLDFPIWSVTVSLPPSTVIQYKYLIIDDGEVTWESGSNNQFTTPSSGTFTLNDNWNGPT